MPRPVGPDEQTVTGARGILSSFREQVRQEASADVAADLEGFVDELEQLISDETRNLRIA